MLIHKLQVLLQFYVRSFLGYFFPSSDSLFCQSDTGTAQYVCMTSAQLSAKSGMHSELHLSCLPTSSLSQSSTGLWIEAGICLKTIMMISGEYQKEILVIQLRKHFCNYYKRSLKCRSCCFFTSITYTAQLSFWSKVPVRQTH